MSPEEIKKIVQQLVNIFAINSFEYPEILIYNILPNEIDAIYEFILEHKKSFVGNPVIYDRIDQKEKPLSSVIKPAFRVTQYEVEPFHFLARGITINNIILPDIGVFVLDKGIALDYEPGSHWNCRNVTGFLIFLKRILMICTSYKIKFNSYINNDINKYFLELLNSFIDLTQIDYNYGQ